MSLTCNHCQGTGFHNADQITVDIFSLDDPHASGLNWLGQQDPQSHDVSVCDCCGDGESEWHGTPGEHYNDADPQGPDGPYAYNGGLCECN